MSEKRNLVHWSILALRDCKLPLASVRHFFPVCINAFCKFSFAYYSFIGSRFWQSVCLFLLLIIRDTGLLPADWNLFALVIQKTRKWQPGRQKIFLFTLNTTALPVLPKMGAKKHHGFQKICGVAAWSIFNLYQQKTVIYIWILLTNVIDSGVAFSDS